jgi:xanthine dehydrogenase molybdopterin-binding subunit B
MRPADGVIFKSVGEELVLLDLDRGIYYGLDPVGARMWQLLAEGASVETIVDTMAGEYDVEREALHGDLARLTNELQERGLLV